MHYCRLDIALELLNKALHSRGKYRRDCVLLAVWHLISWIAGRESIPRPNAISSNDDCYQYCDKCLKPKRGRERFTTTDHLDLCDKCLKKYTERQRAEEEAIAKRERFKQIKSISVRVHKDLATLKR